jgi:hypothetical protein
MVKIGDRVRSFDFPFMNKEVEGKNANYVEGVVQDIIKNRYEIAVDKAIRGGKEGNVGSTVLAPVNGLDGMFGKTDGVVRL